MNKKHRWTPEENEICTREAIKRFVINHELEYDAAVSSLYFCFNLKISKNSIKMKLQNIKSLFENYHIENTLPLRPLSNYSNDNELAFLKLLREYNIKSSLNED